LIDKYGADGLRFGLMRIAPSGQDIRFDEKQIEEGRNFATKLWNAARFRQMHGPNEAAPKIDNHSLSIFAIEVLARLNETVDAIETAYREYRFNEVAQRLYDFFWSDYCDWFVEAAKTEIFGEDEAKKKAALTTMDVVLSAVLRLLHPFMPHITEELWSLLGFGKDSIQLAVTPGKVPLEDADLAQKRKFVTAIYETVQAGRNLRAEAKISSNKKERFVLRTANAEIAKEVPTISRLLNAGQLDIATHIRHTANTPIAMTPLGEIFLIVSGVNKEAERERLDKEIAKLEEELRTAKGKLKNKSFVDRAPAAVVEEHRQRQKDFSEQLAKLQAARDGLN
jgi:valyl-tRNA synthetase